MKYQDAMNLTPEEFDKLHFCTANERLFLDLVKQNSIYYKNDDPILVDFFDEAEYILIGSAKLYGRDFKGVDLGEIGGGKKTMLEIESRSFAGESHKQSELMTLNMDDEDDDLFVELK